MKTPAIEKSRALLKRSDELIVRGCQGHKRNHDMLALGYPVFTQRAQGARFWDVDGGEYVDYLLGFGPILLGHSDPVVNAAVRAQKEEGVIYSTAHPKEVEVAEKLTRLIPGAEMLAFFLGGSATTAGAIRLARAYAGREKIIRCGYHGWLDWCRPNDVGVPETVSRLTIEVPHNDLQALEDAFKKNDNQIACAIIETVRGNGPWQDHLQGCVDICHRYGALCIFDEIKVGFRLAFGGASEFYGVRPDLATYGKACCNGYPGGFVAGRREILGSEKCQKAWLAATFHCDLLSLVALDTVIGEMKRRHGFEHLWRLGNRLIEGVNKVCEKGGLGYRLVGVGPMPAPQIRKEDRERCMAMLRGCLARGFYLHPDHVMFLSLAHTAGDVENTIKAVEESIAELPRK